MTEEEGMKRYKMEGENGGRRNVLAGQFITVETERKGDRKETKILHLVLLFASVSAGPSECVNSFSVCLSVFFASLLVCIINNGKWIPLLVFHQRFSSGHNTLSKYCLSSKEKYISLSIHSLPELANILPYRQVH